MVNAIKAMDISGAFIPINLSSVTSQTLLIFDP